MIYILRDLFIIIFKPWFRAEEINCCLYLGLKENRRLLLTRISGNNRFSWTNGIGEEKAKENQDTTENLK